MTTPTNLFHTHLTSANTGSQAASFESLRLWCSELLTLFNGGQPETVFVSKIVASSSMATALNEGGCTEVLQTTARTGQGLTTSTCTSPSMLRKGKENDILEMARKRTINLSGWHLNLSWYLKVKKLWEVWS